MTTRNDEPTPLVFDLRRFTVRPIKGRWVTECRTCGELRGSVNLRGIIAFQARHDCVSAAEAMSRRAARARERVRQRAAAGRAMHAMATAMLAQLPPEDPVVIAERRALAVAETYPMDGAA